MAEEENNRKIVKTNTVMASGMASVIAAVFTSKLGVAGTLIGTALTSMLISLTSAVLNAQLEKAGHTISGLPSTVRGRISTQRIRVPGEADAEPVPPEPPQAEEEPLRRRDRRRSSGLLERLRAIPSYLAEVSPTRRRQVLLTGALAGLAATVIGLAAITGVEAIADEPLSCAVWEESCSQATATGEAAAGSGTSIGRVFGDGSPANDTQEAPEAPIPSENGGEVPAVGGQRDVQQPAVQPAPDNGVGAPQEQYDGAPQQGGDQQQPGIPDEEPVPQQPDVAPPQSDGSGAGQEPAPGGGEQPVPPADQ